VPTPHHRRSPELQRLPEAAPGELSYVAFAGATFHLEQIEELLSKGIARPYDPATETESEGIARELRTRKFSWHLRGFFWELLGAFDLMLMWANDHFALRVAERDVKSIESLAQQTPSRNESAWPSVLRILRAASDSEWLFEIRTYRNFAHRSFMGIVAVIGKEGEDTTLLPRARVGQVVPHVAEEMRRYLNEMRSLGAAVFRTDVGSPEGPDT
jgi:hypothetical protein